MSANTATLVAAPPRIEMLIRGLSRFSASGRRTSVDLSAASGFTNYYASFGITPQARWAPAG
jgi:hypothetical protein